MKKYTVIKDFIENKHSNIWNKYSLEMERSKIYLRICLMILRAGSVIEKYSVSGIRILG